MSYSEFGLIRKFFQQEPLAFSRQFVEMGIGDDAAIISSPESKSICMSMDVLHEGVHFPASADPTSLGQRALAVNISDLAAMSAEPLCFTLGLSMPTVNEEWLRGFSAGLAELAKKYNCPLVGGDTTSGPLSIAIQVQGLVEKSEAAVRSGAKVGDFIYVTGELGNGALALQAMGINVKFADDFSPELNALSDGDLSYLNRQFYTPEPRIEFALAAATLLTSAIDISDGLTGDIGHILRASGVGAEINVERLPYGAALQKSCSREDCIAAALYGGDDYELCVTVPPSQAKELEAIAASQNLRLTKLGEITADKDFLLIHENGKREFAALQSYTHF